MHNPQGVHRFRPQDPYIRWGDSVSITFGSLNNGVVVERREFQRILLPRPLVCRLHYAFSVTSVDPNGSPAVDFTAINYRTGLGSSAVPTRRVYMGLPQVPTVSQPTGTPLDNSLEVAVQDLYASVDAQAFDCTIAFTLWLAPISLEGL